MANEPLAERGLFVYRQSRLLVLLTYAALIALGLSLKATYRPLANTVHILVFLVSPFLAMALRNRRIEIDQHEVRSYDWRGRLKVQAKLSEITAINIGNGDNSTHLRTLRGNISFDAIQGWADLVRHVESATGLEVRGTFLFRL